MSFEFDISEKDVASTAFMQRVYRVLLKKALQRKKEKGLTQLKVAEQLEVDKSFISRALSGNQNLTLRTLGEICWALDVEPNLVLNDLGEGNTPSSGIQVGSSQRPPQVRGLAPAFGTGIHAA